MAPSRSLAVVICLSSARAAKSRACFAARAGRPPCQAVHQARAEVKTTSPRTRAHRQAGLTREREIAGTAISVRPRAGIDKPEARLRERTSIRRGRTIERVGWSAAANHPRSLNDHHVL